MADLGLITVITPILKSIAVKLVTDYGKSYFKRTPVQKAIKATSAEFTNIGSVKTALEKLVSSDSFAALLEDLKSGRKAIADEDRVNFFVGECGFFTEYLRSHEDALRVLKKFLENLLTELYRSDDAHIYIARTEDVHHNEVMGELQSIRQILRPPPETALQSMEKARKALEDADPHYRLVLNTKGEILIEEKFPGASEEKPLQFGVKLQGHETLEAWKRFEETGEPLDLASPHTVSLTIPEFISRALNLGLTSVEIPIDMSAQRATRTVKKSVTLTFEADSGESCSWDNVILENVQVGTKQTIWSNEDQGIPLKIRFTVLFDNPRTELQLAFSPDGLNVKQAAEGLRFFLELSKGGKFIIEESETGAHTGIGLIPAGYDTGVSAEFLELVEALLLIQRKASISFSVPESVTWKDADVIFSVAQILKTGKARLKSGPAVLDIPPTFAADFLNRMKDGHSMTIQLYLDRYDVKIYGERISIGEALLSGEFYAAPDDLKLLEDALDKRDSNAVDLDVTMTPIEGSIHEAKFIDWLPVDEAEQVRNIEIVRKTSLRNLITLLFESSKDSGGEVLPEKFLHFLEEARNQVLDNGSRPNSLHSCESSEFYGYLEPLIASLNQERRENLIAHLIAAGWLRSGVSFR
jgi:hypothetical protein